MPKSRGKNFHVQRGSQVFHGTVCPSGVTGHSQKLTEPREGPQRCQTPALGWHAAATGAEAQGRADHARRHRSLAGTRWEREHKIIKRPLTAKFPLSTAGSDTSVTD